MSAGRLNQCMSNSPYSSSILKRSAVHFLVGKAASALLTFIILLWLVRVLVVEEYGAYVVLMAGMEIMLAITSLGLPWIAARYLPEFRLHANGKSLKTFIWQLIFQNLVCLVLGSILLFFLMPWLFKFIDLEQYFDIAKLYLLVSITEGLGRRIRDSILGSLIQQKLAQISLVVRNFIFLILLGVVSFAGVVHLYQVVLIEFIATLIGTGVALMGLIRFVRNRLDLKGKNDWLVPRWFGMWRMGWQMYFSHLIMLTYSPQIFVFLTQRYLGVETTAFFGFLHSLYGQVFKYLPATLLFSLIRPKLVASYVGIGGMAELTRNANLSGKLSLFILMPVLVFAWIAESELLNLLSGGRFFEPSHYLFGLLLALIPLSQHQVLNTIAVISDRSYLCTRGAFVGMLALPLAYLLLEMEYGLWSIIFAIIISQILFNCTLINALVRTNIYRPDYVGFVKLIIAAVIISILQLYFSLEIKGWFDLIIIAIVVFSCYMLITFFIKPFQVEERRKLNQFVGRNIFFW